SPADGRGGFSCSPRVSPSAIRRRVDVLCSPSDRQVDNPPPLPNLHRVSPALWPIPDHPSGGLSVTLSPPRGSRPPGQVIGDWGLSAVPRNTSSPTMMENGRTCGRDGS